MAVFSDCFALFPRGKTLSQVFFSGVFTWPNFPQQQEAVCKLHMVHPSPSRANKSPEWGRWYKTSLNVDRSLRSLAVFGLIPQSGDKSPVNLGHTRTVTKEQHRLCVLWLLLKDSPSPAGKNGFILQECTWKKKKLRSRLTQPIWFHAHFL